MQAIFLKQSETIKDNYSFGSKHIKNFNPLLTSNEKNRFSLNILDNESSPYNNSSNLLNLNSTSRAYISRNPILRSYNSKSMNSNNSITIKKTGVGSLKTEIENLSDLKLDKLYYTKRNNKPKMSLVKPNLKNYNIGLYKPKTIDHSLHKFYKDMLTDRNWGNKIIQKIDNEQYMDNLGFGKHISKKQALKELGNIMLSVNKLKLPRERKVELIK